MKRLLVIALIAAAGYFGWQKFAGHGGPPAPIKNPVYGEVRVTAEVQGREIDMALFIRAQDDADCRGRASTSWNGALEGCPTCSMQATTKCQAQLPPRYARLFNDESIPSTYLSATAGDSTERDGRLVVYGLTDEEGKALCEVIRTSILKRYHGTAHCVPASGD
jgi:hypothetical protein